MSNGSVKLIFLLAALAMGAAGLWFALREPGRGVSPLSPVSPVAVAPFDHEPLAVEAYQDRFLAAMELVRSDDEVFDARLEETLRRTADSARAKDALEFVRWKRSGQPLPKRSEAKGDARPNVLLISVDTLRADHLGVYGYERATSPNIDALATRGAVFENAFSTAPWTLPGHMSIFTSMYPSFHKLESRHRRLDPAVQTLTESIKDLGYRTAAFVTHPYLAKHWGFGAGFDLYFRQPRIVPAELQTSSVIDWLDWHLFHRRRGAEPQEFFLFVHYMDPHETYDAPPPFGNKFTVDYEGDLSPEDHLVTMFSERDFPSEADYEYTLALYDGEISYVDHEIGRLLERLDQEGLLDSMVVVLTSDHGEEFKDHGSMGHQSTVHVEQLRVPLIFVAPSAFMPGTRVGSQASLVDIYPTLVGILGQAVPPQAQGADLRSGVTSVAGHGAGGKRRTGARAHFAELGPMGEAWSRNFHKKSIRTDRYRLIVDFDQASKSLFDVQSDPAEQIDLYPAKRNDRAVRVLEQKLRSFTKAGAAYTPDAKEQPSVELDQRTREQLRALGYLE